MAARPAAYRGRRDARRQAAAAASLAPGFGHEQIVQVADRVVRGGRAPALEDEQDAGDVVGERAVGDLAAALERVADDGVVGKDGDAEAGGDHQLAHLGAVGGVGGSARGRRGDA